MSYDVTPYRFNIIVDCFFGFSDKLKQRKVFLAFSCLKLFNHLLIFGKIYLIAKSLLSFIDLNILFSDFFGLRNAFYKTCFQAFQVFTTPTLVNILARSIRQSNISDKSYYILHCGYC